MENIKFDGSAMWLKDEGSPSDQDLDSIGSKILFGRSLFGEKGRLIGDVKRHLISVAPTRSGKGASLIIPNLFLYKGSVMVIDPKGENAYHTARLRRDQGQKTYILDPWDEVNRRYGSKLEDIEKITTFNPLSILNPKTENYCDDLAYIADALIINRGRDPHWDDSARELVAGLIEVGRQ